MNNNTSKATINCPHCGKKDTWKVSNNYRPFCSERCKLVDFGAWANEDYKIEAENQSEDIDKDENL